MSEKTNRETPESTNAPAAQTRKYVLLPPQGLRPHTPEARQAVGDLFRAVAASLAASPRADFNWEGAPGATFKVLDSIREEGAKLVEMPAGAMQRLRASHPGVRIVPEKFYQKAVFWPSVTSPPAPGKAAGGNTPTPAPAVPPIVVSVVARDKGTPIAGALVIAATDFIHQVGVIGVTDASGQVALNLGDPNPKLERLFVLPATGYWAAVRINPVIATGTVIPLDSLDFAVPDCVRFFYGKSAEHAGKGVKVAVVDSGVDLKHPDLHVEGGRNTVAGEDPTAFGDGGGDHHGSHVAGIIAARGRPPTGLRGLTPDVTLRSYRVFGSGAPEASNFAVAKAIDAAVADDCDLINLSITQKLDPTDPGHGDDVLRAALADARAAGCLILAAAGNGNRSTVSFPASDTRALAISALGRLGTYPVGAEPEGDIQAPFGEDKKNFFASFSNLGPEVALICPGVGVISTVPGGYVTMSGTSMACAATTGAAARLLAQQPAILKMPRNQARSDAIVKLVLCSAKSLGFSPLIEGVGLPQA